jgi:putative FmdB family regulatory protein
VTHDPAVQCELMPTYEYRCVSCGNLVEVYQRVDEAPLRVCERCGGELRKVFHPAGIVFKGSGFYATDSRAKQASKDGGDAKPEKTETTEKKADTPNKPPEKSKAGEGSSS